MEMRNKRLATLVGCNYPNTPNELHGCINDVVSMRETLIKHFGFDPDHIKVLKDLSGTEPLDMPTGANIKKALDWMVDQAQPGVVLFFHYSGHGTRVPSANHFGWQDEAIVPCDYNLITDVDFRQLVNRLPKGVSFTMISDSCHSGGLIDKEKEQIGPSSIITTTTTTTVSLSPTPKTIPFASILHHLSSLTGINSPDIGTHLLELFGHNASLKFRIPRLEPDLMEPRLRSDDGILLSGCQANETSADMNPVQGGGKAYGAFSNAVQMVLKELQQTGGKHQLITNKRVVMMAREILHAQGFEQHPCLYCSDVNADATFLEYPRAQV